MFANAGDQCVSDESNEDAKDDVGLKHASHSAPVFWRRDLCDVHGQCSPDGHGVLRFDLPVSIAAHAAGLLLKAFRVKLMLGNV